MSKHQKVKKTKSTAYNVRVVDNGDGTFTVSFVSRYRQFINSGEWNGEWIDGSIRNVCRLLSKGRMTANTATGKGATRRMYLSIIRHKVI